MSNSSLMFGPTPFTPLGLLWYRDGNGNSWHSALFFWTAHNLSGVMFMIRNMLHTLRVLYINIWATPFYHPFIDGIVHDKPYWVPPFMESPICKNHCIRIRFTFPWAPSGWSQLHPSSRTLIYAALMPLNSLWINEAFAGPSGGDVQLEGEEPSYGDDLRKNKPWSWPIIGKIWVFLGNTKKILKMNIWTQNLISRSWLVTHMDQVISLWSG